NQPWILCQHLTEFGAVAPGWPSSGIAVILGGTAMNPQVAADGSNGAYAAMDDYCGLILAQRVGSAGSIAAGWPDRGVMVASASFPAAERSFSWRPPPRTLKSDVILPSVVSSADSGVFVFWQDDHFHGGIDKIYVQKLTASGAIAAN